jgi:predicted DNA-binding protein with PD1-like motif
VEVADQPGALSSDQVERIVELVIARLERRERERRTRAESMAFNSGFLPRLSWE